MFDKRMQELVGQIGDPLVKRRYELQSRLRVSQLIWDVSRKRDVAQLNQRVRATSRDTVSTIAPADAINIERIFLGLCVHFPDLAERHRDRIVGLDFRGGVPVPGGGTCRFSTFIADVMRVIDDHSIDMSQQDRFRAFYNLLNPEFMEALDHLHGRETRGGGLGASGQGLGTQVWGHRLRDRFPVLKAAPHEDFIERAFAIMLSRLEHRTAKDELTRLWQATPDDPDESWFERLVATKAFVETWDAEIFEAEQILDQEAEQMIAAALSRPGVGRPEVTFAAPQIPARISADMARTFAESEPVF